MRLKQHIMMIQIVTFCILLCSTGYARSPSGLQWKILGDISARYDHTQANAPSFILGDIDLWFQNQFTERWSGLGEIMVMDMSEEGEPMYHVHPARLFLKYVWNDAFQLRIGQMHTPIGFYSQFYPHGARFYEPTIHRPLLGRVEHGKELLSLHTVGIMVQGKQSYGTAIDLQYTFGVGNGGAHGGIDTNAWKTPYFHVRLLPLAIEGLTLAVSGYFDEIDMDHASHHATEEHDLDSIKQVITNASIFYDVYPFELLIETFLIRHADHFFGGGHSTASESLTEHDHMNPTQLFGGYVQALYHWNDHSIFLLFESFERDQEDVILNRHTPYVKYWGMSWGYRQYLNQNVLLKVGHKYSWSDDLHSFDLQLAYQL